MKINLTPELFLATQGIDLNTTVLNTFVDGFVRQPDLCALMEEYARMKIAELDYKVCGKDVPLYDNEKTNYTY